MALERKGKPLLLEALADRLRAPPPVAPAPVVQRPEVPRSEVREAKQAQQAQLPDVRHSAHLASWMAGTERELREAP